MKTNNMIKIMLLSLILSIGTDLGASGFIIIPPPPDPIPRPPVHQPIELRSMTVTTEIKDEHALTAIEQVFFNPNHHVVEGSYLFPLPAQAVVEEFTMWINGKEAPAELLDAKKAQQIYEDIVRRMKDPALLQYTGSGLLKARVYPMEPRAEKRLKITYRQILTKDFGITAYRLPLNVPAQANQTLRHASLQIDVTTRSELKTIDSPTHQVNVRREGDYRASVTLNDFRAFSERKFELLFTSGDGLVGVHSLTYRRNREDGYFWLSITPGLKQTGRKPVPKDLVFIVDTSGSMAGEKMDQAKAALLFCLAQLSRQDRYALVRFSTEAEALSPQWIEATADGISRGRRFVEDWQAIGGTNLEEALVEGLSLERATDRMQAAVLITDGKPTIGERDENRLLTRVFEHKNNMPRIFTFGVGYEVNTHLLDKLAERSRGTRIYVSPHEDLEIKVSNFFQKIQSPILTNTSLEFDSVRVKQVHPHRLPDLFSGLPLHVLGRYEGSGPVRIRLSGDVAGMKKEFTFDVEFAKEQSSYAYIPRLWAQRRVGYLLDEIRLHGEERELIDEVIRLARQYGILTPYTSYLIVEDEEQRMAQGAMREGDSLWEERDRRDAPRWRDAFQSMEKKTGASSVAASEAIRRMTEPTVTSPSSAPRDKSVVSSVPFTMVGNRGFYLRQGVWYEAHLNTTDPAGHTIEFASTEYFRLLSRYPELGGVLALGTRVRFEHVGNIVDITAP